MSHCVHVPFEEAILDATGGNPKVLTSAISETGRFPVVDQGQEFVSGYVDDEELVCRRGNDAVILFGDHTKIIKYIDFDFVLGADGVKVLEARPGFDPRFLFHYLNTIRLPSDLGYSRHFKYLKRATVPKPPIEEQRRIAAILDKADAIRKKRRDAVSQCEELKASIMDQLLTIGDEIITETIGNLLASDVIALHKDGNHGGNYPRTEEFVTSLDNGVPFITAKSLRVDGSIAQDKIAYLGEEKANQLAIGWLEPGDVLLAHNATVGPVGIFHGEWNRAVIGTSLTCFRPNPTRTSTEALYAALCDPYFQQQLRKQMKQTTRNQVPITAQRELKIRLPSGTAVSLLSAKLAQLQRLYSKHEAFLADAEQLFSSLTHRAFSGQL